MERLTTDQTIDGEGAPKLVAAFPSRPNWRQFDLVAQDLSEHLPSLRRVRAQESCDVTDALPQCEAQRGGVQVLNPGKLVQFRQICEKAGLSCLVGDEAGLDLVGREGTLCQSIQPPIELALNILELTLELAPTGIIVRPHRAKLRQRLLDRLDEDVGVEYFGDRAEDRSIKGVLAERHTVGADRLAPPAVVEASVVRDECSSPAASVRPRFGADRPSAHRTTHEPDEQVRRFILVAGAPDEPLRDFATGEECGPLIEAGLHALPELISDDPQARSLQTNPLGFIAPPLLFGAGPDDLLAPVPDDLASVQRTVQHFPNARRCPSAAPGRLDAFLVQTGPGRVELENAPNDGRLLEIDLTADALARSIWPQYLRVVVPVDPAAGDVKGFGLAKHGVIGPLAGLLPLHLRGEAGERQHDLVHGGVQCPLSVFEVEEDTNPGVHNLLQGVGGFDLFAPEPRLLRHDEHLKRRAGLERVHEPEKPRSLHELGPADPVVHVEVLLVGHLPALLRRICARVL